MVASGDKMNHNRDEYGSPLRSTESGRCRVIKLAQMPLVLATLWAI